MAAACAAPPPAPAPSPPSAAPPAGPEALLEARDALANALACARRSAFRTGAAHHIVYEPKQLRVVPESEGGVFPLHRGIVALRLPERITVEPSGRILYPPDFTWVDAATFEQAIARDPDPARADVAFRAPSGHRIFIDLDEAQARIRRAYLR